MFVILVAPALPDNDNLDRKMTGTDTIPVYFLGLGIPVLFGPLRCEI